MTAPPFIEGAVDPPIKERLPADGRGGGERPCRVAWPALHTSRYPKKLFLLWPKIDRGDAIA
jgi:hypothetical protein